MLIEQHIEELRAELRNAVEREERQWIIAELAKAEAELEAAAAVLVTSRMSNDGLWRELQSRADAGDPPWQSLTRIGDALAPATVAHAVYAGHRYAREFDTPVPGGTPYKMERVTV